LLVCGAEVKVASVRGERVVPLPEFVIGPKRNVLAEDELILGVSVDATESRQTFMKVGPRNAMVIAVVSLAVRVDGEHLRAAFGSAGPVPTLVRAGLGDSDSFPQRVAEAASPIDDVRGTALYRRHALHILTRRALDRCLA
jgi:CO/xanthine dehydrogenase FAD-binding subunit